MIQIMGSETMSKFYAVRKGVNTGIFKTWSECEAQVKGFSGAEYKSFSHYDSAVKYLGTQKNDEQVDDTHVKVYVDGSYSRELNKAGYGCVFISENRIIHTISQSIKVNQSENLWNVSAEIAGVLAAVDWAINQKMIALTVYYDYEGLRNWVDGSWKTNKETTSSYVKVMKEYNKKIKVNFVKVKAHSGDKYNEMADKLAKNSLEKPAISDLSTKQGVQLTFSLSDYKEIVGDISMEECQIIVGDMILNDKILRKIAKSVWRNHKYLIKDMGKTLIKYDVHSETLYIEILNKNNNSYENFNIVLESV